MEKQISFLLFLLLCTLMISAGPLKDTEESSSDHDHKDCKGTEEDDDEDVYDQRQNGTENYFLRVNGLMMLLSFKDAKTPEKPPEDMDMFQGNNNPEEHPAGESSPEEQQLQLQQQEQQQLQLQQQEQQQQQLQQQEQQPQQPNAGDSKQYCKGGKCLSKGDITGKAKAKLSKLLLPMLKKLHMLLPETR